MTTFLASPPGRDASACTSLPGDVVLAMSVAVGRVQQPGLTSAASPVRDVGTATIVAGGREHASAGRTSAGSPFPEVGSERAAPSAGSCSSPLLVRSGADEGDAACVGGGGKHWRETSTMPGFVLVLFMVGFLSERPILVCSFST
jgi:hypothetical protein